MVMSNRLPNGAESKRLLTARRLLATGAVLLLLTACSDNKRGTSLPRGTNLEHVDVSEEDARATIYDRIQNHAQSATAKIVNLISKDSENDTVYTYVAEDEKKRGIFHASYEFGYDSEVFGPSKFAAYVSLKKGSDGKLDPATVDFISIEDNHTKDHNSSEAWGQTIFLSSENGDWSMTTRTTEPLIMSANNPNGESFKWGGPDMTNPKTELPYIDGDLAGIFDVRVAELLSHDPVAS